MPPHARRPALALAALVMLWLGLAMPKASTSRADQCPPIATTTSAMRINGTFSIGGAPAPIGTGMLAIGPAAGALPDGCTTVSQTGTFAMMVYGYDAATSLSQTYPREADTLTLYSTDSGGNLTFLRASQPVSFRSGTTVTVALCGSCNQNAINSVVATDTPTPSPSPTPAPIATSTPGGNPTATPIASETPSSVGASAPAQASAPGTLPPQFAGTPSASLPSNFATGGGVSAGQGAAPPPSANVLATPPRALVVPGPVQLPPDGSVSLPVVLQGLALPQGGVGPALQIGPGTLVTDWATGVPFSGVLWPPEIEALASLPPGADSALERDYVLAAGIGGKAVYAITTGGAQLASFSRPATVSLPAQAPVGYEPAELHVVWFDPSLASWSDLPGSSSDGVVVVAGTVHTGLFAVVAANEGGFRRYWVQTIRRSTLWSGVDPMAVPLGIAGQWDYLLVLAPQAGDRLFVRNPASGGTAYVNAADVGPSGPP